jgi:hypothetical protein
LYQTKAEKAFEREMDSFRKVSPLHAARMLSRRVVDVSRDQYHQDEQSLRSFRLSIEIKKEETIKNFNNNE